MVGDGVIVTPWTSSRRPEVAADVAPALDRCRHAIEREALLLGPVLKDEEGSLAGGLLATERAAALDGLAGDNALGSCCVAR